MHGNQPGAGTGGRSVCAAPFDGRELGPLIRKMRQPLPEIAFFGMGIASGADLKHFLNVTRSTTSLLPCRTPLGQTSGRPCRAPARDAPGQRQRARGAPGQIGGGPRRGDPGLLATLGIWCRRTGPFAARLFGPRTSDAAIRARRGVVLACGGFPGDPERRRELFPHTPTGQEHWTAAPRSNTGDGLRLGEQAGGYVNDSLAAPAAWAPVSLVPHRDGTFGHFPHLIDRAKPGFIAVTADGRRFVNEALSYYDYISGLLQAAKPGAEVASWAICDRRFLRRYGLGFAKPTPLPIKPYLASGYLKRGQTIPKLAQACGIDPDGLARTVEAYNRHARDGEDPEFGRGSTPLRTGWWRCRCSSPTPVWRPSRRGRSTRSRSFPAASARLPGCTPTRRRAF